MSKNTGSAFVAPVVKDYGTLVELTSTMTDGEQLDAAFPSGTPRGDLTFS